MAPGPVRGRERRTPIDQMAELLGPIAERDRPIGPLTTYRVGGRAALYVEASSSAELEAIGGAVEATGVPVLVVGKGSNLLVADAGFAGVCVRLSEAWATVTVTGTQVRAGGATAYPVLARRTAAAALSGMEWAVGIPGSVGGAVRMNAGGHGAQTADRLLSARVVDLGGGGERLVGAVELDLGYRRSAIRRAEVVVEAEFELVEGDAARSTERIGEIVRWRREHQPGGQNAGSVFTNPPEGAAGRLVEAAGLKGLRVGTAAVSEKHANFIQADPEGSADDVRRLIETVQRLVAERLGVELETELRLAGFEKGEGER